MLLESSCQQRENLRELDSMFLVQLIREKLTENCFRLSLVIKLNRSLMSQHKEMKSVRSIRSRFVSLRNITDVNSLISIQYGNCGCTKSDIAGVSIERYPISVRTTIETRKSWGIC